MLVHIIVRERALESAMLRQKARDIYMFLSLWKTCPWWNSIGSHKGDIIFLQSQSSLAKAWLISSLRLCTEDPDSNTRQEYSDYTQTVRIKVTLIDTFVICIIWRFPHQNLCDCFNIVIAFLEIVKRPHIFIIHWALTIMYLVLINFKVGIRRIEYM